MDSVDDPSPGGADRRPTVPGDGGEGSAGDRSLARGAGGRIALVLRQPRRLGDDPRIDVGGSGRILRGVDRLHWLLLKHGERLDHRGRRGRRTRHAQAEEAGGHPV